MTKIELKKVSFSYPGQAPLFEEASIVLDTDWKLGLVGRNGRGKTSFLKLLNKELEYSGKIINSSETIFFPRKIHDKNQLACEVVNEIALCEQWQLERELNLLKVDPAILWRPYCELSGGEQTKLQLALLFLNEGYFPLIDEPTNHLDSFGRETVANYLKQKTGFIVVSHDKYFLNQICNYTVAIEKSNLKLYQGNYSVYEYEKGLRDDFEISENVRLKSEITRLKQTAAAKKNWSNHREDDKYGNSKIKGSRGNIDTGFIGSRSARVMKKSKQLEKRMQQDIADKSQLLKDIEVISELSMNYQPSYHNRLIFAERLSLSFDEELFCPISFEVSQTTRLAFTGVNGSGKTSIIKLIKGDFSGQQKGTLFQPSKLKISFVRQNYDSNRGFLKDFAYKYGLDYSIFLNILKKLGMERSVFEQKIELMSMGQRKKVEIAKSLCEPAELYIWDEPLNYLDVYNREQLIQLISKVKPPMVFIEHDQDFLAKVATEIINIK